MSNNFNLRGFILENKLSQTSKIIKEQAIEGEEEALRVALERINFDRIMNKYAPKHITSLPTVDDYINAWNDQGGIDTDLLQDLAALKDDVIDFASNSEEMSMRERKNEVSLENEPKKGSNASIDAMLARSARRGNPPSALTKPIDRSTIEVDGVDSSDYPDFADAFISYAEYEDGTPLTDDELDKLTDEMADEVNDMAIQSIMEGLTKREKTLKEAVLKSLK